jgi:hypothetical protein
MASGLRDEEEKCLPPQSSEVDISLEHWDLGLLKAQVQVLEEMNQSDKSTSMFKKLRKAC